MNTRNFKKICVIAAFVGSALVAGPASAVAIETTNVRPAPINPPPVGEGSVQSILDSVFLPAGSVNAVTGQSSAAVWQSAVLPASTIPTMVIEYSANSLTNKFGIWFGNDTSNILAIDLLLGPATAGSTASLSFTGNTMNVGSSVIGDCTILGGTAVNCGAFTDARISSGFFGFYIDVGGTRYYSADQLNGGAARMLAYEGSPTNWLLAFEDGTDNDFNDLAVKIESITRVPEPGTLALFGFGLLGLGFAGRRRV